MRYLIFLFVFGMEKAPISGSASSPSLTRQFQSENVRSIISTIVQRCNVDQEPGKDHSTVLFFPFLEEWLHHDVQIQGFVLSR